MRKQCKRRIRRPGDMRLACQPWKIEATYSPIERILFRLEADGTVDVSQGKPVFHEDMRGGWYNMAAALNGIVDFHTLAEKRHGFAVDTEPLRKLANKLEYCAPIFENDIARARQSIESCKRQALRLTVDEADDLLTTCRIGFELEKLSPAAPAQAERFGQTAGNSDAAGTFKEAA